MRMMKDAKYVVISHHTKAAGNQWGGAHSGNNEVNSYSWATPYNNRKEVMQAAKSRAESVTVLRVVVIEREGDTIKNEKIIK